MPARILVIDDDPTVRELLGDYLKHRGYSVMEAMDGLNAVAVAKLHLPDLLIIDFRLPAGDGVKVLERLRKDKDFAWVPAIFISGYSQEVRDVVPNSPLVKFLPKPLDLKTLDATIQELLKSASAAKASPSNPPT